MERYSVYVFRSCVLKVIVRLFRKAYCESKIHLAPPAGSEYHRRAARSHVTVDCRYTLTNTPLRSRPIWANRLLEVAAGSETNSKLLPGTEAFHSAAALVIMNSPAKPCVALRTLTRLSTPLH